VGARPWSRAVGLALPYDEWLARDRAELAAQVQLVAGEVARLLRATTDP
jgi:hypothetical protein